jgi:hypothetical protein
MWLEKEVGWPRVMEGVARGLPATLTSQVSLSRPDLGPGRLCPDSCHHEAASLYCMPRRLGQRKKSDIDVCADYIVIRVVRYS